MYFIELIIACISILIYLILLFYSLIKKFSSNIHKLFCAAALTGAAIASFNIVEILGIDLFSELMFQRTIFALSLLYIFIISMILQLYPIVRGLRFLISFIIGTPILILSGLTITSDLLIKGIQSNETLGFIPGPFFQLTSIVLISYYLITFILMFINSRQRVNSAFRRDIIYLFFGMMIFLGANFTTVIVLPISADYYIYDTIGVIITGLLIILNIFYAILDIKSVDMKRVYLLALYWTLILSLLFIPIMIAMRYNYVLFFDEKIPFIGMAIILFIYLFLVFKFIRPKIESLFQRGYKNYSIKLDDLFSSVSQISISTEEESYWDNFFKILIDGLVNKFDISSANFYLFNSQEERYLFSYGTGKLVKDEEISDSHPLIRYLNNNPVIIYRPVLYYDKDFSDIKDDILNFFNSNSIELIIPFINEELQLIGLLVLGNLKKKKIYSKTFLSILDIYRLQFQHHLANALTIENVKSTQAIEHDRIVIESIKEKIIPKKLFQLERFRISSFFINNSKYGGDYYDSIEISDDKAAIFICDSSYSGIDSAIISLELYTVLHSNPKKYDMPDEILRTMNWVISTSRFSNKYATALCLLFSATGEIQYSNAAFNPIIVFNPNNGSFTEHTTQGIPIGVDNNSSYLSAAIKPSPGSIGIIYSDGLISSINEKGESYNTSRVKDIIINNANKSPGDISRLIFEDFKDFTKNKRQINDISVIIFNSQ